MTLHPSEPTLLAAAAGILPPLHATVLAQHTAQCPLCRAGLRNCEAIGGAVLEEIEPASLPATALARTLSRLDESASMPSRAASLDLMGLIAAKSWRWLAPGIQLKTLVKRDESDTRLDLIRVAPGTALPHHDHTGPEIAYVMQGAFQDESGCYQAGDIAEGTPGLDHAPVSMPGVPCICLIATTGRLRASSLFVRGFQAWLDI